MKKLLTLAALATLPMSAMAHHGHNSQFDVTKIVKVSGVITDLGFVNPHAYVYFDVTGENGEVVNWHCEMRAASVMKRSGWTADMFKNGTAIDVVGVASRKEANGCYVETVALAGGEAIERYAQLEENKLEVNTERPAKTAWGVPYIGGDWAAEQRLVGAVSAAVAAPADAGGPPGAGGPPRRGGGTPLEYSVEGLAALKIAEATISEAAAETATGRLDCNPRDFFRDWTFDQPSNRIIQEENKIVLKYGFMDTERTIHLDMKEHPANITSSFAGHSIGHWDGDVLVVDTVGFAPSVSWGRGRTSINSVKSDQLHVVERFTLDTEKGSLTRAYTSDDSLYWAEGQQQSGQDVVLLADYPWEPYACDDRTVE